MHDLKLMAKGQVTTMVWLEYLLPLIFLFPMAAMGGIVLALRSLHDARVHSPFDAPLRELVRPFVIGSTKPFLACS